MLLDETGMLLPYKTGAIFAERAQARITYPDQRSLRFLVRGTWTRM